MSDRDLKQRADQELRYKAIVLKDPESMRLLHEQVVGKLFCNEVLQEVLLQQEEK